jgi:hypothetical protein
MKSKLLHARTLQQIIWLAAFLSYIISFFLPAFTILYLNKLEVTKGFEAFLMGALAILGGGTLEWIIWLANPLALLCFVQCVNRNRKSIYTGIFATILASSFFFWQKILASESGHTSHIESKNAGYFLWLFAILLCTINSFMHNKCR